MVTYTYIYHVHKICAFDTNAFDITYVTREFSLDCGEEPILKSALYKGANLLHNYSRSEVKVFLNNF